jgi:hypothetical protein
MNQDTHLRPAADGTPTARIVLIATAIMLAALTIIQAGRIDLNAAHAGTANAGPQGSSMVTIDSGLGPKERPYESLWVLDSRGEMLFIYYVENANAGEKALLLRQVVFLPDLFRKARGG